MSYDIEHCIMYGKSPITKVCDITMPTLYSDHVELCYHNSLYGHVAEADYLPCMEWGVRRRVYFTIALSHAHILRIPYDVIVVPTRWNCLYDKFWGEYNRYWGGEAILQMSDMSENHVMSEISTCNVTQDCQIIGWQQKLKEEEYYSLEEYSEGEES